MDEMEYRRMRQERYLYKKRQRMLKRRRRNLAILMIILIIATIAAISYLVSKILPSSDSDSRTSSSVSEDLIPGKSKAKPKKNGGIKEADYSSYYCYEKENQSRYEAYHSSNPELTVDEVVWQVNANLDYPFYGHDVPVADITDPLVIVNKYYKVDASQEPELVSSDGYLMTPDTAKAYEAMKRDAASNGLTISAASTYRSVSYQEGLYNSYLEEDPQEVVDTYSARAGYSEHHTGMAIDFIGSFGSLNDFENTPEYPWERDNCHKYGFIIRYTTENQWVTGYKNEPWHLRYLGEEIATDMKNKGVSSYEEYKVKYIDHTP